MGAQTALPSDVRAYGERRICSRHERICSGDNGHATAGARLLDVTPIGGRTGMRPVALQASDLQISDLAGVEWERRAGGP